jgi:hypothetical protein
MEHHFGRFSVSADAIYNSFDYEGAQNFRDNNRTELRGRLDYEVSPRIGLGLQATADARDYNHTPGLSSDGQVYLAGVTLNGDLFRGEVWAGYFRRDFDNPAISTFDGLALAGDLEWFASELTTVTFEVHRDANAEISATAGLPYVTTEGGIRVDHELLRNLILSAEVSRGKREYDTVDRQDDYTRAALGADYVLNRHAALHLRFEHFDNDSSGTMAYHDSNVNVGTLGVSLRL